MRNIKGMVFLIALAWVSVPTWAQTHSVDASSIKQGADKRMDFERTKDPTYIAFDHIDNLPLHTVLREMTKETIKDLKKIDLRTSLASLMQRR